MHNNGDNRTLSQLVYAVVGLLDEGRKVCVDPSHLVAQGVRSVRRKAVKIYIHCFQNHDVYNINVGREYRG